jgi:hypothetical protein
MLAKDMTTQKFAQTILQSDFLFFWCVTFLRRRSPCGNRFLQAGKEVENTKEKIQAVLNGIFERSP